MSDLTVRRRSRLARRALATVLAAGLVTGCVAPTGGRPTATVATVAPCTPPARSIPPSTATPPPTTSGPPPPTATAIIRATPTRDSPPDRPSVPPRIVAGGPPPTPMRPAGTGPVPPTVAPTATSGPPPPSPTATRVGVPPRRLFISMGNGGAGVPGITPRAAAAPPGMPTYSEQDVCEFARTHPLRGMGLTIATAPDYTITSIRRTTVGAVALMYGTRLTPPEATLVYTVEMQGVFTFSGGPAPGRLGTFPTGIAIFDARTGAILLEGGLAR